MIDTTASNKRRTATISIAALLSTLGLLLLSYAYFIEPSRLVVTSSDIRIAGWSKELDGLRIVAISDIHGGSNGADDERLRQLVKTTNAVDPDLVVLLGDYVSQTGSSGNDGKRGLRMPVATVADHLSGLRSKLGVFAVLGNHDGWHGDEEIARELTSRRIQVLDGGLATVQHNGASLRILGLKDQLKIDSWEAYTADARTLLAPTEGMGDVIILEHSPDVAPIITAGEPISKNLRLMIAGHTHGGQVWLPVLGRPIVPSGYGQRYAAGHTRDKGLDMFVTTGVGTSILPFRFMVPPEIAVLTIRSAD